jgi:hypothetical protein
MLSTYDDSLDRKTDKYGSGGDKYDVRFTTYPADLFNSGGEKYGRSWVMININVNSQSAQSFGAGAQVVETTANERRRNTNFDNRQTGVATGTATAAIIGGGATLIKNLLVDNKGFSTSARNAVGTASSAGSSFLLATGPAAALAGTSSRETKRISSAIQLPMPNALNTSYGMMWGEDNTALFDFLMRGADAGSTFSGMAKAIGSGDASALRNQGTDALVSKTLAANNAFGNGGVSAMTGLAANPKKEMVFEGVSFRTFQLRYKMFPKNFQELMTIDQIVRLLKFHMHPEYKSEGKYTFIYPSEFDITFYTMDGYENKWVTKIGTAVLTDLSVDYTPDGQWVNYGGIDSSGAPNAFEINMTFKELSILTKEDIARGF